MLEAVPREIQNQNIILFAGMAELADALDSGSSLCKEVQVQVLLPAPTKKEERRSSFFVGLCNNIEQPACNVWRFAKQMATLAAKTNLPLSVAKQ